MSGSTCRSCACPLEWAITVNGKRIPLQFIEDITDRAIESYGLKVPDPLPSGHRYFIKHGEALQNPDGPWLSHFVTCTDARTFSHGGKKAPPIAGTAPPVGSPPPVPPGLCEACGGHGDLTVLGAYKKVGDLTVVQTTRRIPCPVCKGGV